MTTEFILSRSSSPGRGKDMSEVPHPLNVERNADMIHSARRACRRGSIPQGTGAGRVSNGSTTVCGTPAAIGTSSTICVYILSIPTCSADPVTLDGRRSKSVNAVFAGNEPVEQLPGGESIM